MASTNPSHFFAPTVWIAVAGIGLFLLISGIVGIIAKG